MNRIRCFTTAVSIMVMAVGAMIGVAFVGGLLILFVFLIDLPYLLRVKKRGGCLNLLAE